MTLILGIDDAGRGPVIGPMILAGCIVNEDIEKEFKRLGVKDSKQLTAKRRDFLEGLVKEQALGFYAVTITPEEIDKSNADGIKLNEVEAIAAAKIINKLNDGKEKMKVIIDCPSVSLIKWRDFLKTYVTNLSNLEIFCEHKADQNHVSVSAASILAKSQREREMEKLKKEFGDEIGSGYGADPTTQKFLTKNATSKKHTKLFRKTWSNWQEAAMGSAQKKLS